MNKIESKQPSGCLVFLIYSFAFILWVMISAINRVGALLSAVVVLFVLHRLWRRQQEWEKRFDTGFSSFQGNFNNVTDDDAVTAMLAEELQRIYGTDRKPVCKSSILWRSLIFLAYLGLNFLMIQSWYETSWIIYVCTGVTVLFTFLFLRANTYHFLLKKAKKNPNTPLDQLIRQSVSENSASTAKTLAVCGAILMAATLTFFCVQHAETRWSFSREDDGYCVTRMRPGLFEEEFQLPDSYRGEPIVAIGSGAFQGNSFMEDIEFPETILRIGGEAFMNCKRLERITIPEGVTEIRGSTFESCSALESVKLHDGIVDIHAFAFKNCDALKQITLPAGITEIHEGTFRSCNDLESIVIPDGVVRIAAHAFRECGELKDVTLPDSLLRIGSSAFRECDELKRIVIPKHTDVDERAFKESPTKITRN